LWCCCCCWCSSCCLSYYTFWICNTLIICWIWNLTISTLLANFRPTSSWNINLAWLWMTISYRNTYRFCCIRKWLPWLASITISFPYNLITCRCTIGWCSNWSDDSITLAITRRIGGGVFTGCEWKRYGGIWLFAFTTLRTCAIS